MDGVLSLVSREDLAKGRAQLTMQTSPIEATVNANGNLACSRMDLLIAGINPAFLPLCFSAASQHFHTTHYLHLVRKRLNQVYFRRENSHMDHIDSNFPCKPTHFWHSSEMTFMYWCLQIEYMLPHGDSWILLRRPFK